jgi:hypothetical protein
MRATQTLFRWVSCLMTARRIGSLGTGSQALHCRQGRAASATPWLALPCLHSLRCHLGSLVGHQPRLVSARQRPSSPRGIQGINARFWYMLSTAAARRHISSCASDTSNICWTMLANDFTAGQTGPSILSRLGAWAAPESSLTMIRRNRGGKSWTYAALMRRRFDGGWPWLLMNRICL